MKHLLIILSILLLSFLLSCDRHKGETRYLWKISSGEVWKESGDKDTHPKYIGEVGESGNPNGNGFLVYTNEDEYEGEFKDGKIHGVGTYTWSDNKVFEKYVGEFINNKIGKIGKIFYKGGHIFEGEIFTEYIDGKFKDINLGKGIKTLPDGGKYEGVWKRSKDDKISKWEIKGYDKDGGIVLEISEGNGKGLYVGIDGYKYVGEYKDGKPNGQGTFTFPNGSKYVGEYKDGKPNGQGTFTGNNGNKYVGEYKDGKRNGQATYTWSDGTKFVGEYKDGLRNGQGTEFSPDGYKYVGEFKDDKFHGQGTYTWSDGNKYVGEFYDGKQKGQGTFTYSDGNKYVGEWKNGLMNGQGTWTFPNGSKYVGEWKDGNNPKKDEKEKEIARKKREKERAIAKKKEEKERAIAEKKEEKERAIAKKKRGKRKDSPGLLDTLFEGELAQRVKYAKLGTCPGKTLEEMAKGFMGSHSWSSGSTEDGNSFVNLKGQVTYMPNEGIEKTVTAVIQFQLNNDETFQFHAIELNEIPQPTMMGLSLLEKMCDATKE